MPALHSLRCHPSCLKPLLKNTAAGGGGSSQEKEEKQKTPLNPLQMPEVTEMWTCFSKPSSSRFLFYMYERNLLQKVPVSPELAPAQDVRVRKHPKSTAGQVSAESSREEQRGRILSLPLLATSPLTF